MKLHHEWLHPSQSTHYPPVLLLHGWGRSLQQMRPLAQLLASTRPVLLIDLPGFGRSELPEGIRSSRACAEQVARLMEGPTDVIGHSFGGKVASWLALDHADKVRRLVLMGASGLPRVKTPAQQMRMKLIKFLGKTVKVTAPLSKRFLGTDLWQEWFVPQFGSPDYRNAGVTRPLLVATLKEDLTPLLPKVQQPALLLWGEKDTETPLEVGQRWNALLPNSQWVPLPGKGHDLLEQLGAHLLATRIEPFLETAHP